MRLARGSAPVRIPRNANAGVCSVTLPSSTSFMIAIAVMGLEQLASANMVSRRHRHARGDVRESEPLYVDEPAAGRDGEAAAGRAGVPDDRGHRRVRRGDVGFGPRWNGEAEHGPEGDAEQKGTTHDVALRGAAGSYRLFWRPAEGQTVRI